MTLVLRRALIFSLVGATSGMIHILLLPTGRSFYIGALAIVWFLTTMLSIVPVALGKLIYGSLGLPTLPIYAAYCIVLNILVWGAAGALSARRSKSAAPPT